MRKISILMVSVLCMMMPVGGGGSGAYRLCFERNYGYSGAATYDNANQFRCTMGSCRPYGALYHDG